MVTLDRIRLTGLLRKSPASARPATRSASTSAAASSRTASTARCSGTRSPMPTSDHRHRRAMDWEATAMKAGLVTIGYCGRVPVRRHGRRHEPGAARRRRDEVHDRLHRHEAVAARALRRPPKSAQAASARRWNSGDGLRVGSSAPCGPARRWASSRSPPRSSAWARASRAWSTTSAPRPTFCAESGCATVRASAWSHPLGHPDAAVRHRVLRTR